MLSKRSNEMNITIILPETFTIESRGASVAVSLAALSVDIVAKLMLHGLGQKVGDSAASALADAGFKGKKFPDLSPAEQKLVSDAALESMGKVAKALEAGDWGVERVNGGRTVDPIVAEVRSLLRGDFKAGWIAKNSKDGWKALEEDFVADGIDELFAEQDEATQTAIRDAAVESLRLKAAAKKTAKGFTLAMPK